ncbi:MAG TPA: penicillin-binding protein activator LpoB [Kiritimatiellia bacterium]|nr:penicillin-binding protein activator LpoB [Kiritimatiellia bacterium]
MMKKVLIRLMAVTGVAVFAAGCASTGVTRGSLDRERAITERFDPDDARRTVEFMVDDMLQFGPVVELTMSHRPVLDLQPLQNRTMEHIDTRALTTAMRTRLLRSGKFRFVDQTTAGMDIDAMTMQRELGLVDPNQAVRPGQQTAFEMYLYGEISQMRTTAGRTIDQYYMINMSLQDLRTGEIVWTSDQEIRKERTRSRF